jgi:hypothetical protein
MPDYQEGTVMANAVVMTGYGLPEVLKWAGVPLPEPGQGQIRIKVKAAGISPTDLALRAGYLKAIPLPPDAVLGFEAAGTVDAVGPGVTGTSVGDGVAALLFSLGGYAEYAVASIWTRKPESAGDRAGRGPAGHPVGGGDRGAPGGPVPVPGLPPRPRRPAASGAADRDGLEL